MGFGVVKNDSCPPPSCREMEMCKTETKTYILSNTGRWSPGELDWQSYDLIKEHTLHVVILPASLGHNTSFHNVSIKTGDKIQYYTNMVSWL